MKLDTNHPWVKRIKNCSKEGPASFQRGDTCNNINVKIEWNHSKIFFSRTTEPKELIFT
jgi:hypothetical protein